MNKQIRTKKYGNSFAYNDYTDILFILDEKKDIKIDDIIIIEKGKQYDMQFLVFEERKENMLENVLTTLGFLIVISIIIFGVFSWENPKRKDDKYDGMDAS